MSGGALEELGVSPEAVEECGIYQALLKVIDKRNLQAHLGTLDLALQVLVFIRQRTGNFDEEYEGTYVEAQGFGGTGWPNEERSGVARLDVRPWS